ncbi:MAG: hypothetical protein EA369_07400 [Bradymonadales bacterium]|nr:MAG: hypothetical protein EA369_07400 [Bradymonadales bacterium]
MQSSKAFNCFSFWAEADSASVIARTSLEEHIRQSILICLFTEKGERPLQPEFGSRLSQFVFRSADASYLSQLCKEVRTCLEAFEPRIELRELYCETSEHESAPLSIHLSYLIKELGTHQSMKIPFNL